MAAPNAAAVAAPWRTGAPAPQIERDIVADRARGQPLSQPQAFGGTQVPGSRVERSDGQHRFDPVPAARERQAVSLALRETRAGELPSGAHRPLAERAASAAAAGDGSERRVLAQVPEPAPSWPDLPPWPQAPIAGTPGGLGAIDPSAAHRRQRLDVEQRG